MFVLRIEGIGLLLLIRGMLSVRVRPRSLRDASSSTVERLMCALLNFIGALKVSLVVRKELLQRKTETWRFKSFSALRRR